MWPMRGQPRPPGGPTDLGSVQICGTSPAAATTMASIVPSSDSSDGGSFSADTGLQDGPALGETPAVMKVLGPHLNMGGRVSFQKPQRALADAPELKLHRRKIKLRSRLTRASRNDAHYRLSRGRSDGGTGSASDSNAESSSKLLMNASKLSATNGRISNLCFGGVDFDTLFATCGDRVF
ncbi:MAG TPA: hypothetical protein VH575_01470 [Gemmataceae bacterium]|jgi:hypothetical protein